MRSEEEIRNKIKELREKKLKLGKYDNFVVDWASRVITMNINLLGWVLGEVDDENIIDFLDDHVLHSTQNVKEKEE